MAIFWSHRGESSAGTFPIQVVATVKDQQF